MDRRALLAASFALPFAGPAQAATRGERMATAARRQLGLTTGYDPAYRKLAYPMGDVPRETGVCTDVIIRAARDGLGLDLQKLIHEDMTRAFGAYPHTWNLTAPDSNIDHRRVPNQETFWRRAGAQVWQASGHVAGNAFPAAFAVGDILTWRVIPNNPHVGLVIDADHPQVIHNIGGGVEIDSLWRFLPHAAHGHYRWPVR